MRAALKDLPPLILASASPRRVELLRQLSLDFKVVPADVAEIHHEQMTARELSQVNAYRKARAVAKKFPDALVLAADTLVYLETALFGKPATLEEAYQMLEQLQGRTHQVVTGICLLHLRHHRQAVFAESTAVTFHPAGCREDPALPQPRESARQGGRLRDPGGGRSDCREDRRLVHQCRGLADGAA